MILFATTPRLPHNQIRNAQNASQREASRADASRANQRLEGDRLIVAMEYTPVFWWKTNLKLKTSLHQSATSELLLLTSINFDIH
jgi:hypothetical protein